MMHRWGRSHVSSALEVFMVLTHPPCARGHFADWEYQLTLEPPTWGGAEARNGALILQARGYHVWSWDDYAVVYSRPDTIPPRGVFYRTWRSFDVHEVR